MYFQNTRQNIGKRYQSCYDDSKGGNLMREYKNIHTYSFAEYTQSEFELADFSAEEGVKHFSEETHAHDWIEMIYIKSGSGVIHVNGEKLPFSAGDLIRFFPFHIHGMKAGDKPLEYIRCQFPLSVLMYLDVGFSKRYSSYYVLEYFPPMVRIPAGEREKVCRSFQEIIAEEKEKDNYSSSVIIAELTKITILFERASLKLEKQLAEKDRTAIWEALQYMHLFFNQEIDAKKTADRFGMSVAKLNHELYRITGKSFTDNLHEIRIRNACAMMPFPELSITYIHKYVGYQSPATFYRIFRKLKHASPEEYRKDVHSYPIASSDKADTVWKIVMHVADHFKEEMTPDSVSQQMFLSTDTIKKALQSNLSLSFHELLQRVRMLYACSLLKATALEIGYIAAYAGFDSLRTFNRNFKEYMGTTPSRYREESAEPKQAEKW